MCTQSKALLIVTINGRDSYTVTACRLDQVVVSEHDSTYRHVLVVESLSGETNVIDSTLGSHWSRNSIAPEWLTNRCKRINTALQQVISTGTSLYLDFSETEL